MKSQGVDGADDADATLSDQSGSRENRPTALENKPKTTAEVLRTARAAGIEIALKEDDGLPLETSSPSPDAVLDTPSRNKTEIAALPWPGHDGWSAEDWRTDFDERAGIIQFEGGLTRSEAEAQAFDCCLAEWMNRHAVTSSPDRCLACGGSENTDDPLTKTHGCAWLHSRCWQGWHEARKAEAIAALIAMGIEKPANFPNDFGKNRSA